MYRAPARRYRRPAWLAAPPKYRAESSSCEDRRLAYTPPEFRSQEPGVRIITPIQVYATCIVLHSGFWLLNSDYSRILHHTDPRRKLARNIAEDIGIAIGHIARHSRPAAVAALAYADTQRDLAQQR